MGQFLETGRAASHSRGITKPVPARQERPAGMVSAGGRMTMGAGGVLAALVLDLGHNGDAALLSRVLGPVRALGDQFGLTALTPAALVVGLLLVGWLLTSFLRPRFMRTAFVQGFAVLSVLMLLSEHDLGALAEDPSLILAQVPELLRAVGLGGPEAILAGL